MSDIRGVFNRVPLRTDVVIATENEQPVRLLFHCPGCRMVHGPSVGPKSIDPGPRWTWNGSYDKPVFSPSLIVRWDTLSEASRARNNAHRAAHGVNLSSAELPYDVHHICHSFIGCNGAAPGQIIFLHDCTHAMAGKVVDLVPFAWDHDDGD